jgi:hypothetical protein
MLTCAEFSECAATLQKPWVQANKLDAVIGQAFSLAERKCYTSPRPPWSEKLYFASLKVRYWRIALSARRTHVNHALILADLEAKIWPNIAPPTHPRNLRALPSVARAADRALRRVRRVALAECCTFLETLRKRIALRTKTTQTSRKAALKNVTRQLQDTHRFSRIKRALDPIRQPPLTKVELVHESAHLHPTTGERILHRKVHTVDTRQELEDCIIACNKRHFA